MVVRPARRLRRGCPLLVTAFLVIVAALVVSGCAGSTPGAAHSAPARGPAAPGPALSAGSSASAGSSTVAGSTVAGSTVAGSTATICGHPPPGPAQPPANALRIDPAVAGDLAARSAAAPPGTTFWLAPGTHRLGGDRYDQVKPKDGDTYVGAPGAVLDGAGANFYAFVGKATHVTITNLTVRGFTPPVDQGVVNHDSGADWLIEHSTLTRNAGAALMAGPRQVVRGNCFADNGQYGLNACCGSLTQVHVIGNEFVGNNTADLERRIPGCGCTGAMKFWSVDGADVVGNWIHENHGPGIWADTDNNDFLVEGNLIEGNDGPALLYETSYNATVRGNLIRRNNLVEGKAFAARKDTFPAAAVYLSESGGDPRIKARTDRIDISGNVLVDNWSGITLWENADRFCNSLANTSTGACTLLVPRAATCRQPAIATGPLFDDCRWKTQRVAIHGNRFSFEPAAIGCRAGCARMAVLSNVGTFPSWSPYQGSVVQQAITFRQDNRWYGNTYVGPWRFTPMDAAGDLAPAAWQRAPYDQDQGSTFTQPTPSPTPPTPSTPSTPSPTPPTAPTEAR